MAKINGGIIGPNNPTGPFSAGGVWRLEDAFNAQKAGTWPVVLGYQIPNSLRFNGGSSDNLTRTPATTGTSRTTMTFSFWTKRSGFETTSAYRLFSTFYNSGANQFWIRFADSSEGIDKLSIVSYSASAFKVNIQTTQVFRDPSAWYHFVVAFDTTQATSTNRVKVYVNGSQITSFSGSTYPAQNQELEWNPTQPNQIGGNAVSANEFYNGYFSEIYFIDGQQLTPSSFGETDATTGIWIPKAYTGTYGTNGFYLKFANSASLGTDSSGNGNNFTVNNLTSIDQSYDSPTNNFCTWNPLWFLGTTVPNTSFSEGNLAVQTTTTAGADSNIAGTIGVNRGKWYYEFKMTNTGTGSGLAVGFANNFYTDAIMYYSANGNKYTVSSSSAYGATWTTNDIIGVAIDCDNNTIIFYKNGTSQGTITSAFSNLSTDFYLPQMWDGSGSLYANGSVNFGYPPYSVTGYADANGFGNFSYAPPSGYYSLCSKNLALYG